VRAQQHSWPGQLAQKAIGNETILIQQPSNVGANTRVQLTGVSPARCRMDRDGASIMQLGGPDFFM
jgi:hypothetical protein